MNTIIFEKKGNIGIAKMNRPQQLNSLNRELLEELAELIKNIKADKEIKVLIITGEGKAFVAGADIAYMKDMEPTQAKEWSEFGNGVFRSIETLGIPTIAAVNGFALGGGCELALACDIRIASEKAKFGQPEINLGIIPGFGGTQRLPNVIGIGRAKELLLTGRMIDAETALSYGLVSEVLAPETLMEEAMEIASQLEKKSPVGMAQIKYAVEKSTDSAIDIGIKEEARVFGKCFGTEHQRANMDAFLNKK